MQTVQSNQPAPVLVKMKANTEKENKDKNERGNENEIVCMYIFTNTTNDGYC